MQIPVESVPDGAVFAPHHIYVGLFVTYFVARRINDIWPRRDPWAVEMSVLTSGFAFATIWPFYHLLGSLVTLGALLGGLGAMFVRREYWYDVSRVLAALAALGLLIALDDVVNHTFGLWTPLDWLFHAVILPLIRSAPATLDIPLCFSYTSGP